MRKVFKWVGIVLGAIVALVLLLVLGLFIKGSMKLSQIYTFPDSNIVIPTDAASIARGDHIVHIVCVNCHGPDMGGMIGWFKFAPAGQVDSANLTTGKGGVGMKFKDQDYIRVLRHGVDEEGKGTFMVAVLATQNMSDTDLADVVAYIKTLPPVDRETGGQQFTPMARVLLGAGVMPWPAELAQHFTTVSAPPAGVNVRYGEYLTNFFGCKDCHGQNLAGGPYPEPGVTFNVPNITQGGEVKSWSEAQFLKTIRSGVTPGGHKFNELMPWKTFGTASDDELKAIFMYIQSLPAVTQTQAG